MNLNELYKKEINKVNNKIKKNEYEIKYFGKKVISQFFQKKSDKTKFLKKK